MKNLKALNYATPYEQIIALDIETGSKGQLLDIGVFDGHAFMHFTNWKKFFDYIMTLSSGKYRITAHNGFGFDYITFIRDLLTNLDKWGLNEDDITFLSSEALIIALVIKRGKLQITFVDTLRFFPATSLNNLAKDFLHAEKDDVPDDYISRMEEYKKQYPKRYYSYLKQDCVLLYKIYSKFRDELNTEFSIGELGLSSGSTALKCFRSTMEDVIFACPFDYQHIADEALRGGFTQYIGDGKHDNHLYSKVTGYDIISMYPSLMRIIPVPTAPPEVSCNSSDFFDSNNKQYLPGFYLTTFDDNASRVPFLYDVEQTEPCFKGTGLLTHLDLAYLELRKIPYEIHEAIYYPFYDLPFTGFVNRLLEKRLQAKSEGETAKATAYKIVLNSLYGKFAQGYKREVIAITKDHDWYARKVARACKKNEPITQYFVNGNITLYGYESNGTSFSNRLIGAMVTAFARLKLGMVINTVPAIYCDTDSVFTQSEFPTWLIGKSAGYFEKTCENVKMICLGKKSYMLEETIKFKGIPKQSLTPRDIDLIRQGETIEAFYRTPTALKTALKKGVDNPNCFETKSRRVKRGLSMDESHLLRKDKRFLTNSTLKNFFNYFQLI